MKKANRQIVVSGSVVPGVFKREAESVKGNLPPVSRRYSISKSVGFAAAIVAVLGITFVALSYFVRVTGAGPVNSLESSPQLGSPPFANPSEVRYRTGEKIGRLRGVMELNSGNYTIPNVGTATLRQLRGWDPNQPAPPLKTDIEAIARPYSDWLRTSHSVFEIGRDTSAAIAASHKNFSLF